MARVRVRINRSGVRDVLTSSDMQRVCERVANDIAGDVRAAGSYTYGVLEPTVQSTPRGGVRGDRAMASVVVPPPPPDAVRYPDRDRFDALTRVLSSRTRA